MNRSCYFRNFFVAAAATSQLCAHDPRVMQLSHPRQENNEAKRFPNGAEVYAVIWVSCLFERLNLFLSVFVVWYHSTRLPLSFTQRAAQCKYKRCSDEITAQMKVMAGEVKIRAKL